MASTTKEAVPNSTPEERTKNAPDVDSAPKAVGEPAVPQQKSAGTTRQQSPRKAPASGREKSLEVPKKDDPAYKPDRRRRNDEQEDSAPSEELRADHLVNQQTGQPDPVSVQTENFKATLSGDLGRVLLKVGQVGMVGEEPIVVVANRADELRELADKIDEIVAERVKSRSN